MKPGHHYTHFLSVLYSNALTGIKFRTLQQPLALQERGSNLFDRLCDRHATGLLAGYLLWKIDADLGGQVGSQFVQCRRYAGIGLENAIAHNGCRMELRETMLVILQEDETLRCDGAIGGIAFVDLGITTLHGLKTDGIINLLDGLETGGTETICRFQVIEEGNAIALRCQHQLRHVGRELRECGHSQLLRLRLRSAERIAIVQWRIIQPRDMKLFLEALLDCVIVLLRVKRRLDTQQVQTRGGKLRVEIYRTTF